MKNSGLSNAIGNVNLRYIEEMENYTAKRMSLTKIISLAACIAILVTAIPAALVLNREEVETDAPVETTPIVIETTEPDKGNDNININNDNKTDTNALKVIYCDAQMVGEIENAKSTFLKDTNVAVKRIDGFFNSLIKYKDAEYNSEIPQKFTLTLGNYEFECTFDHAFYTKALLSTDETLKSYAEIACYKIDQEGYSGKVYYRVATKEIARASINRIYQVPNDIKTDEELMKWYIENLGGNLTIEDVVALSEKDLMRLYGDNALSEYRLEAISDKRELRYRRYVNDFPTKETVAMEYTTKGELLKLENLGYPFEIVDDDLSVEKLLKTDAEALEIIDEEYVQFKRLVMGNDSAVYIYYRLGDGKGWLAEVYYKVE